MALLGMAINFLLRVWNVIRDGFVRWISNSGRTMLRCLVWVTMKKFALCFVVIHSHCYHHRVLIINCIMLSLGCKCNALLDEGKRVLNFVSSVVR